jgi:murein L,D-transpeptidase YafK
MLKASLCNRSASHSARWQAWLLLAGLASSATAQEPDAASARARSAATAQTRYADRVLVDKSEHTLTVFLNGEAIASFKAGFGVYPGAKQRQGDRKTPEGKYVLDYKNENSAFYRSIHISYPDAEDRARARRGGYPAGGDIMVHGQPNDPRVRAAVALWPSPDWTDGCISLENADMKRFWELVRVPVPIEIRP